MKKRRRLHRVNLVQGGNDCLTQYRSSLTSDSGKNKETGEGEVERKKGVQANKTNNPKEVLL